MGRSQHGMFNCHTCQTCAQLHLFAGFDTWSVAQYVREVRCESKPGFLAICQRCIVSLCGYVRFQCVCNCVDTSDCGDNFGLSCCKRRIKNRNLAACFLIPARHLHMSLGIRNQGERLSFTSGPSCGWNSDHWQHWLTCFANTPIVFHFTAIGI